MQSKKIRKKGLQPKKRYFAGGTIECPNPPCPPEVDNRVQTLLNSGMWKQGPNGELLRKSAEELNRDAYEKSKQEAMGQLAVEDPNTFAPTTSGFMTPERKTYLESRAGKLTPEEAREYATVSFDPFEGPNMAFSFAAGATPVDPVGQIIGRGLTALGKGYRTIKNPRVMPVMEEARMEASIQGIREHFGIELGHVVDGVAMTPEKMRQIVIKDLVGESASAERLARANQAIDLAIDEYMPKALETVMRRSEGNLLDIPVDTRHPQLDRVRMRFLGPNSKLWQQANKEGLIPVQNIKQSMSNMSEMEKAVLEEAIFRAPVYNKKGVLLQGEELRNAQDAIISAVARPGMGPSIEESAEGIGDISGYRINLNQLKGLTETTSYTSSPIRTMEYRTGTESYFGDRVSPMIFDSKQAGVSKRPSYGDYGLSRIGYQIDNPVDSKTFIIGSDNYQTNVSHFERGELAHFRTFTNDLPKAIPQTVRGLPLYREIDFNKRYNQIRYGQGLRESQGTIEWHPDMSRVPSGLGISRGGNFTPSPNLGKSAITMALEPENYGLSYLSGATNRFLETNRNTRNLVRTYVEEAKAMQREGRPLVESDGDVYKAAYDFANKPDMADIIKANVPDPRDQDLLIGYLDNFARAGKREVDSFYGLKNSVGEIKDVRSIGVKQEVLYQTLGFIDEVGLNSKIVAKDNPFYILQNADGMKTSGMWGTISRGIDASPHGWSDMTSDIHNSLETYHGTPGGDPGAVQVMRERFIGKVQDYRNKMNAYGKYPNPRNAHLREGYFNQVEQLKNYEEEITKIMDVFQSVTQDAFMSSEFLQNAQKTIYNRLINTNRDPSISMNQLYIQSLEEVERRHPYHIAELKNHLSKMDEIFEQGRTISTNYGSKILEAGDAARPQIPDQVKSNIDELTEDMNSALQQPALNQYYDILESENNLHTFLSEIRNLVEGVDDVPGLSKAIHGGTSKEANRFYVSEIQADFVQKASDMPVSLEGSHNTASVYSTDRLTKKGSDPTLDSFAKNWRVKTIQQAVLQGRKAGKTEILFPTYNTADKIQGWGGSKDTGVVGSGNRITYQSMDKHIQKATGIKPTKVSDEKGNEWWMIKVDPDQKYEFPDFKYGGKIRLRKK